MQRLQRAVARAVQHGWSQGYGASSCLATGIFCGCSVSLVQPDRRGPSTSPGSQTTRHRAQPHQQAHQRIMRRSGKAGDQGARQLVCRHRRHELGAARTPQRSGGELLAPPVAPARERAPGHAQGRAQTLRHGCRPGRSGRHQHHRKRQVSHAGPGSAPTSGSSVVGTRRNKSSGANNGLPEAPLGSPAACAGSRRSAALPRMGSARCACAPPAHGRCAAAVRGTSGRAARHGTLGWTPVLGRG